MRISTSWSQQLGVNAMLDQQSKQSKTQMQLSTGLKILTPADDPAGAARTLDLQESIAKTGQYQDNITMTRARLNIEEAALSSSENVLFRAKELTIQALNAPLTTQDRLAIKEEVDQLLDNLVGIANTKNANGEYIFSGDLSNVQPFKLDSGSDEYVYQGGINQRALQIAPERQVADGDLGFNVFQDIDSVSLAADATVDGNKIGKQSVFTTLQTLSKALAGNYDTVEGKITGDRFLRYGVDYSPTGNGATSFDISVNGGAAQTVSLAANYTDVNSLITAINGQLAGVEARANGNKLEFITTTGSPPEVRTVQVNDTAPPVGSFLVDAGFSNGQIGTGIDTSNITDRYNSTLNNVLTDLNSALSSFIEARASVGARLNAVDDQQSQNEKFVLDMQTILSETRDLDYAETISRFNLENIALQAAQQAFSRVQNLSLFNFLR
jgi:flagellar hook-associated protein 3 FlgL